MASGVIQQSKTCTRCAEVLPATEQYFNRSARGKLGLKAWCRACTKAVRKLQRSGIRAGTSRDEPDGLKRCSSCRQLKPATREHFYAHNEGRMGLQPWCKHCFLERCKLRYERERGNKPRRRFGPWLDGEKKACSTCKSQYPATLRYFNRAKHLPGRLSSQCKGCKKASSQRNKERWADSGRASVRNYRARKRGARGKHSATEILALLKAQKHRCWWCDKNLTKYHVDHRIPLSRGGDNDIRNLVISCPSCNCSRGSRLPWEMREPRLL